MLHKDQQSKTHPYRDFSLVQNVAFPSPYIF
jgi:hypothetical protein